MKKETMTEDKAKQTPAGGVLVGKREGQTIIHDKGTQGGYFVGRLHKEGGIKGINKSTGQPIEVQGGEVIITAPAVADQTKRDFEGEMLTNREILSKINEKGGGVSLENGGEIYFNGSSYNYGGKTMTDYEIMQSMNDCGCEHEYNDGGSLENFKYSKEFSGITIYTDIEQEYVGNNYSPFESKGSFKATVRKNDLENIALESKDLVNFNFIYGVDDWNTISKKLKDKKITKLELYQVGKTIKTFELKPIIEEYKKGGQMNLVEESKKGDHTARDLNNYNDLMDVEADGMVGAESGLFAYGGRVSNSKLFMPSVRGGWTKEKIIKYQKSHSSDTTSTLTLLKYISEFSDWEQFKNHIYYHGTQSYIEKGLKPSITMSEREVERIGGGGYGQRYFGVSLTKRKRTAESFSGMSNGVIIYPVILKRDAKVIERTDLQDASEIEDIIVELYEKGVDAVYIGGGEEELVVVNPYSILLYKIGREYHSVFGGFKSVPLTDEKIKEIYTNSKILSETYTEEYNSKQNKEEREQFLKSIPEIKFDDGGEVGADFTFLKSNPMQRARAINVLEKKIRHDGKIMSNYEFLEGLPKDLEVGVSKLHSRKTETGYVEKLSIGDFIVDAKAEIDYYKYLQENGYPYSKYIKEVREAEAKKNEADKIIRDKQNEIKKLQDIENYKNSEIAKNNQIKELIENGANAMIKKMNAPRLIQIEKYKTQRQTNDVKNEIDYHTRMIEQTERQVNSAYKIASKLYEIVDGEVQPKFDWKVGDKVKVEGYLNHAPAEIETEIVELKESRFGKIVYRVESKEGISNSWISYDGLFPLTENNITNYDWDTTFTNGFNKGQKLSEQEIETIDVYNDFVYGLNFKSGGSFDAKTEETIGLLLITDNPINLAVILEKDPSGFNSEAIKYNQKIKRRLYNLAEKSNRKIVLNNNPSSRINREFPYLLVSEKDSKNYDLATEFYEKLETPRNESRKKLIEELEKEKQGKKEYEYVLTQRPFGIGTYPTENFLRFEDKDYQYGVLVYSQQVPLKDVEHYSLSPITELKEYDGKTLSYSLGKLKIEAKVKLIEDKRKGYFVNVFFYDSEGIQKTQMMSGVNFLKQVEEGKFVNPNETKEETSNYENKTLDELREIHKRKYSNMPIDSPKSEDEKLLDKLIAEKFSLMNEEIRKKREEKNSFEGEGSKEGKGKLYEFFTPQMVADKMLALAQHYGFKGGNVLEPASGNGRLLKHLKDTNITAFEISKDNFEILKREFPNAELYNFNFEKAFLKEPRFNTLINKKGTETWLKTPKFDLVLANPPYGKFSGLYSSYFNFKGQVEHFFILQTLHLLKKGGLGVYLIPSSFLRNGITYNKVKQEIFEIAELVDAYRLPSNIFEKTQIGTDILILRKK